MILNNETSTLTRSEILANVARPVLKVVGLGGGGCNAVERMIELGMSGIEFIAANTDFQVLQSNPAPTRILLGPQVTRGFGAGGNPQLGRAAAIESRTELAAALAGADMVFLAAGMGGGTGTGAIPVAAEIARALGAVTIAIVTTPFSFEMGRRQKNAREGKARLQEHTHTLLSIDNDRLLSVAPRDLPLQLAFRLADDVLRQSVQAISELITETGLINVDFSHVRRLMLLGGGALMAIGQGEGSGKAIKALEQALEHPLLDSFPLERASGVIANFTGGRDLSLFEVQEALSLLQLRTGCETEMAPGVIIDERMEGRVQAILIITGLEDAPHPQETLSAVNSTMAVNCAVPHFSQIERRPVVQPVQEVELVSQPVNELPPANAAPIPRSSARRHNSANDFGSVSQRFELPAFLRHRAQLQEAAAAPTGQD